VPEAPKAPQEQEQISPERQAFRDHLSELYYDLVRLTLEMRERIAAQAAQDAQSHNLKEAPGQSQSL
jgi:hypothetical protein